MVTNTEVFERNKLYLHRRDAVEVLPPLDRPCDQDGGSPYTNATSVWRATAGSQETGPFLQTFQGHSKSRLEMVRNPTNRTGCYCSGQTTPEHTYTICVICTRGRASPPSTFHQRTPPLSSPYPSNNCEFPVPSLCTALQVQDRPPEPLPYSQIEAQCHPRDRGTTYDDLERK